MASNSQRKQSDSKEKDSQKSAAEVNEQAEQEQKEAEQKRIEEEQKALDEREKETQKQADESDTPKQTGLGEAGDNPAEPKAVDADDLPDPKDDNYDPYQDPSVPSSVVADNVRRELDGLDGESPTLDACREAYKAQQDK